MLFFLIVLFILTMLIVSLTVQNSAIITLTFFSWTYSNSIAVMLAIPFAAGLVAGLVLFFPLWWKKATTLRKHKKRVKELEDELLGISEQASEVVVEEDSKEQNT